VYGTFQNRLCRGNGNPRKHEPDMAKAGKELCESQLPHRQNAGSSNREKTMRERRWKCTGCGKFVTQPVSSGDGQGGRICAACYARETERERREILQQFVAPVEKALAGALARM